MRRGPAAPTRSATWTNPANALTILRALLVPVIAVLVVQAGLTARWWAFGLFSFAAVSDSVDGWVARRWQGSTRWGQLADPAADKVLVLGVLAVLVLRGEALWWPLAIIVVREAAVTVLRTLLSQRGVVMAASNLGKAKTLSQLIAVSLYLLPAAPPVVGHTALIVAAALSVVSGMDYARQPRRPRDAR